MEKEKRVLIIDDDTSIITELISLLQPEYRILVAKDGMSGINRAEKYQPDLILLDFVMPDMNGFDVLSSLRKLDGVKNIPVIFMTGIRDSEKENEGKALGAVDYIRKPFDRADVKLKIRKAILK